MAVKPTFATPGDALSIQTRGSQKHAVGYPDASDVTNGLAYGPALEFTGTNVGAADYPSEDDVRYGVDFDSGGQTGNMTLPAESNVVSGVLYGTDGVEFEGEHSDALSFTSSDAADLFLPAVFRAALLTSGKIAGGLGPYDFGDGDEPACFTNDRYLFMARRPLIYIEQRAFSGSEGDRAARSFDAQVAIEIWGNRSASDVDLMGLAQEVWNICDRLTLNLTGWSTVDVDAQAPDRIDDPDGFPGYSVMCDINLLQEA